MQQKQVLTNREFIKAFIPYSKIIKYKKEGKRVRIRSERTSVKVEQGKLKVTGHWEFLLDFSQFPTNNSKEFWILKIFVQKTTAKSRENSWCETSSYVNLQNEFLSVLTAAL